MPSYLIILIPAAALVLLLGIALLIRALIEPRLLDVDRELIRVDGRTGTTSDPPLLRVVFFSDLHGTGCKVSTLKIIEAIFSQPCDVILFGGDISNSRTDAEDGLSILRAISVLAAKHSVPCYAVRGNHDRFVTAEDFSGAGFHLLENEFVTISGFSGKEFLLIGLDDSGKAKRVWPVLPEPLPMEIPQERRIVLVHNPDYVFTAGNNPAYRIQLSGHLHGGQIFLPFRLEFKILRHDRLPREGIIKGPFSKNGISGYISRGLGCVIVPLRLFSKPQITHIAIG
jgi:hypothetical protein